MELMQLDDEHINLLKAVLNSFMRDPSRFIDDTSVEKLLSWLSTVCRCEIQVERLGQDWILQFIYDSLDQDKAVITAFAIRLIGMLAAWPFYFQRMQNLRQYNLLDLLASMPSQSSWKSATVRDAYFKAANNLIPCRRSFNWIVAKDMVTVGLSALGDDSIFVMKSAINFVVQYLLWHGRHHFQEHSCDQEPMDLQYYNDVINEISNLLTQSKLSLASIDSQLSAIAIIVDYLALADEQGLHLILNSFPTLGCCIHHILHTGDFVACNQVTSIFKNICSKFITSWDLNWNAFVNSDRSKLNHEHDNHSNNLLATTWLSMPLALYRRGFITTGMQLCASLSFYNNAVPRELSICNPKLLSEILYRPLHLVMYGMFTRDEQDVSLERSIDISLDILKAPILADQLSALQKHLDSILTTVSLGKAQSQAAIVCHSIESIIYLFNMGYQDLVSATWINSVVVLFALCSCPSLLTKEIISKVNDNITGSIKIARAALDFVSHSIKQIKIIRQSQLPFCPLLGEAIDPVYVILAAINQIDLEEAILIKSLNLLSEILLELNDDEIILLLDTYRISSNQVGVLTITFSSTEAIFNSNEGCNLLHCISCALDDARWEVRDSGIALAMSVFIKAKGNKEIYQQVINGDLVEKIWKLSNDDEGFVKASALNSMCQLCSAISKPDDLDPVFKENKISDAVFQIILNDTEALARRSAIDLVIQCFKYGFILKDVGNCASETAQDIINVLRNESNITSTLRQSCHDLDWEVKRRGLLFWKAFIERHWQESCTEATAKHYTITSHNSKIILSLVLSGCAIALQDAIEDCDVVIQQESCAILLSLQTKLNLDLLADSKAAITEQLREFDDRIKTEPDNHLTCNEFFEKIMSTNYHNLIQACDDARQSHFNVKRLMHDLLFIANQDTLLDCY
ncbi:BRCA1-associated ATM activator 1 [Trichoplax sp. H2]|nr:BRCA1-associated ATM activator 1 [Trichoplax sp. H2]|eukprot:RDD43933.1 BRCA1-associated ATM activator 1 [Trichoplax sp. H2]